MWEWHFIAWPHLSQIERVALLMLVVDESYQITYLLKVELLKFLKAFLGDSPFLAVVLLAMSLSVSLANGVHTSKVSTIRE